MIIQAKIWLSEYVMNMKAKGLSDLEIAQILCDELSRIMTEIILEQSKEG
jgi:hypothetical protein